MDITPALLDALNSADKAAVGERMGDGIKCRFPERHTRALDALAGGIEGERVRSDVIRLVMDAGFAALAERYGREAARAE